jgi:hypothetical protein
MTEPGAVRIVQTSAVQNIDPRGECGIQLSTNLLYPDSHAHSSVGSVEDIKLHLRLSATVEKNYYVWDKFSA